MHVLITGATGLIGRHLVPRLLSLSYQITILSRQPSLARQCFGEQVVCWSTLDQQTSLDGFDAVINLAGEPIIGKRWTAEHKQTLCHSRWDLTRRIVTLIKASHNPPSVLISGSAIGYYGDQGQSVVDEDQLPQPSFTHQLCDRWESYALQADAAHTRVCLCRTGIVLSQAGGALTKMLPPFRLGLGGPIGDGQQYFPWIHIEDMVNAVHYLLVTPGLHGPFNLVAPYPVKNARFTAILAEILQRPAIMRVPAVMLRLALGEAAMLLLAGQKALPQRLQQAGFSFRFLELQDALNDLLGEKK